MTGYPLLDLFWTMLWFFLFIVWLFILFRIILDIFRSHDMGGWGKAGWLIFIIILPFLGVLVYLIARGKGMAERDNKDAADQQAAFKKYVQDTAAEGQATSQADELAKLAQLHDSGALTDAEFAAQKAKVLG
jgi:type VI protein secretion system component VasK